LQPELNAWQASNRVSLDRRSKVRWLLLASERQAYYSAAPGARLLLRKYGLQSIELLDRVGLDYERVCYAIAMVNRYKGAKHGDEITAEDARKFRTEFLTSAFNLLFPAK
jgi:hypothetical protein